MFIPAWGRSKQIFIVLLLFHTQLIADDKDFAIGDTLFVWAENGVVVRTQPSMESEVLTKLNYGEKVIVVEVADGGGGFDYEMLPAITVNDQAFPRITVFGKFIKINLPGSVGYIYGGLLSRLKPMLKDERFEAYLARVFGQLRVAVDVGRDNSGYKFNRTIYKNGAISQQEHGNENWWSYLFIIPDISLSEAYLLVNRLVSFETNYKRGIDEKWDTSEFHPTKFEPGKIVLQTGIFEETNIKHEPHYILITMSGGN